MLVRVEPGGGDLIEEGLEGVVVALVDDRDVDLVAPVGVRAAQGTCVVLRPPNPAPTITTRGADAIL